MTTNRNGKFGSNTRWTRWHCVANEQSMNCMLRESSFLRLGMCRELFVLYWNRLFPCEPFRKKPPPLNENNYYFKKNNNKKTLKAISKCMSWGVYNYRRWWCWIAKEYWNMVFNTSISNSKIILQHNVIVPILTILYTL